MTETTVSANVPVSKKKSKRIQIPTAAFIRLCIAMHEKKPECTLEDLRKCVKKNFNVDRETTTLSSQLSSLRAKVKNSDLTDEEKKKYTKDLTFVTTGGASGVMRGVSFTSICRTVPKNVSGTGETEMIAPDHSNGMALDFDLDF